MKTSNEQKTSITKQIEKTIMAADFDIDDDKGRSIGYEIEKSICFFEIANESNMSFAYRIKPGKYYHWTAQATRNGKKYGACQEDHYCLTAEQRAIEIEKYIKSARNRALKNPKNILVHQQDEP